MKTLWRWFLRKVVGAYVEPTPIERFYAHLARSTRITLVKRGDR
jgi:hypothetical protein